MIVCYPQPSKARSREVLVAFAVGCGGEVRHALPPAPDDGPAAFYGVVGIERLFDEARRSGRDWFYGDNTFFDRYRGRFFRFGRNEFQLSRLVAPDHARAQALGITVRPWRAGGRHIVVVEQSPHFLGICGAGGDWLARTVAEIKRHSDRPLRLRPWRRDKDKAAALLPADLAGAWALVTHMSAAAVEALVHGVPVFVTGACAATPLASGPLSAIEAPLTPAGREDWVAGLAAQQWTLEELRSGAAWRALRDEQRATSNEKRVTG